MRQTEPSESQHHAPAPISDASRQRLRLKRSLTAQAVYGVCIVLQWIDVAFGSTRSVTAFWFSVFMLIGNLIFFIAIRSGWNRRFAEPALTLPQMLFALVSISLAYAIDPHLRGALIAVAALVLVFGAFTLRPAHCRWLGGAATAMLGAAMVWGRLVHPEAFGLREELSQFLIAVAVLPTIGLLAGELGKLRQLQRQQKRELREALRQLHDHASHDALTGLPNRRHVQQWLRQEAARSRRTGAPLAVALIDLDHFKRINDELGHVAGDEVLRIFAREAATLPRSSDLLARWGGEEFLLLMPDTPLSDAERLLSRLRAHLGREGVWPPSLARRVTFSAGVTTWVDTQDLDETVNRADRALYEAKRRGRDCVVIA
jgi:diguanylate cyclase (GGDEF)-like protein